MLSGKLLLSFDKVKVTEKRGKSKTALMKWSWHFQSLPDQVLLRQKQIAVMDLAVSERLR